MGNCLKSPTSDDISLLHETQSDRASFGDGTDPDLEPPPPYQVRRLAKYSCKKSLFQPANKASCCFCVFLNTFFTFLFAYFRSKIISFYFFDVCLFCNVFFSFYK